jgi:putative membrane protein
VKRLLVSWAVMSLAVAAASAVVPGIDIHGGVGSWIVVAAVLGIVNAVIGTFVRILALPITILTLGIFAIVINAVMLDITDSLLERFHVGGFGSAILGAIVISIVSLVLDRVVGPKRRDRRRDHS